jgi:hypothetical protein
MRTMCIAAALTFLAGPAFATPCDDVKAKIAEKLDKKGVKNYTLEAVADADVKDRKVVGTCEGGKKKLVYTRGASPKS